MGKHAEIIYETGAKSVVAYDDEAELKAFVTEHTNRAKSGEPGSAQDWSHRTDLHEDEPELEGMANATSSRPAERISKVLLYDKHPADYAPSGVLYVSAVSGLIDALKSTTGDESAATINVHDLIAALRREINAVKSGDVGPHDSHYKMQHTGELDLRFLSEGGN